MDLSSPNRRLGIVVEGSLTRGLDVKLDGDCPIEEMAVGRFVTLEGSQRRFFGVITDVSLGSTDDRLADTPPDVNDPFIAKVVSGASAFGLIHVTPYLTANAALEIAPAKTIPAHFTAARTSDAKEIEMIFGGNDAQHIWIGSPLDMEEAPVCLDIKKLVERSTGVFGKTGTGKSFLTRILLAGIIQKAGAIESQGGQKAPVSLIFDMHSEYGWRSTSETGTEVKGLKQLFNSRVAVFTLDENSARARGISADFNVQIGYDEIEGDDIAALAETLGLSETMVQAAYRIEKKLGRTWVTKFLETADKDELASIAGGFENESTLAALRRKLEGLQRLPFLTDHTHDDSVKRLMEYLERGTHVVLEFGGYSSNLTAYIFVANFLTRRLHHRYVQQMERSQGSKAQEPRPLVIAIEEAHKFLSPELASQTIFGTIARELRKYNVTLLVIDQRPSGIDTEIMSQLGSKITCLLENDRDIEAVLAGVSGGRELRGVLAKLESKQQALVFGHAVPMPVVVRTRTYDAEFYRSVGFEESTARTPERTRRMDKDLEDLFGR